MDIIYVKSRGYNQEKDYSWWNHKEQKILVEKEIDQLIDGEYFSLVVARYNHKLFLYVTALESNRVDFRGRKIRNSVLWEYEDIQEEKLLQVAVCALQNQLSEKIESSITEDKNSPYGFHVDEHGIKPEKLIENKNFEPKHNSKLDPEQNYLAHYHQSCLQELAEELKKEKLPNREGVLVVVTTSTTEVELEKAGVWRGISELVHTEEDKNWKEIVYNNRENRKISEKFKAFLGKITGNKTVSLFVFFLISLATVYKLNPDLLSPPGDNPSPVITIYKPSIQVSSDLLSSCEVKFKGSYNPQKTPNIFLKVDGIYEIGNSESGRNKINLNPQERTWNFAYKFSNGGKRKISLKGKDTNGNEVPLKEKTININNDCKNKPS